MLDVFMFMCIVIQKRFSEILSVQQRLPRLSESGETIHGSNILTLNFMFQLLCALFLMIQALWCILQSGFQ